MNAAKVIGRVVATSKWKTLEGKTLLLLQPTDWNGKPSGDMIVAADSVGAGAGEFVFYVKSREACFSWLSGNKQVLGEMPPLDATVMGIIDGVDITDGKAGLKNENL
ncbi:MAG: EutN/CcmL family microcompartment protein [Elusimicrobiota bacterium]|nr:EutN/CcmL family microcompartment protein [Elusimicrobiota bacterium]